ncbi:MAG: nickel-dependent lactate racemase [Acidobacteriota bacterium]
MKPKLAGSSNRPGKLFTLPYGNREISVRLARGRMLGVFSPHSTQPCADPRGEVRRALQDPVGMPSLDRARLGSKKIVIITDDMTRLTPLKIIVPEIIEELNRAGFADEQISVIIGLGTHRPMTGHEIIRHFGQEVVNRVSVLNHPWQDQAQLANLGETPNGTPISVCRMALEADFIIGVGSIVPHHIPGYSGGAKIVQPGITSAGTTAATHLLSVRAERSCLGVIENPVRTEMEAVADRVGLSAVFNCVLDSAGNLIKSFYGDPKAAFRKGVFVSRQVYGVQVPGPCDIVVAGSYPCDIEFWQAHKALYPAEMMVRQGGRIIIVTPCAEGVAVTHQEVLNYASHSSERLLSLNESGAIKDPVSGALALAWARVREHAGVSLVSDGITDEQSRALGFTPYSSVEDALGEATASLGSQATVSVLTQAPDMLPIIEP